MFRFLLYAVIAYLLYQFVMAIDWGSAFSSASRSVNNTANDTYNGIMDSSIMRTIGDVFRAIRDLLS